MKRGTVQVHRVSRPRAVRTAPRTVVVSAAVAAVVAAVWIVLTVASTLTTGPEAYFDPRPGLLCVSLVGMATVSYVVWPSRWNIVAHMGLAFSLVAYVVPIVFLDALKGLTSEALDLYYQVCVAGFFFSFLGVLVGKSAGGMAKTERLLFRADFGNSITQEIIASRVFKVTIISTLGVLIAFAFMGFVPALAPDPFAAKFFKGAYGVAYGPVAPLYRAATTSIAILMPIVALYAWRMRTIAWVTVLVGSVGVMLLGLLRGPAITGVLLLIGVFMAVRRRGLIPYVLVLTSVYFIGASSYYILAILGVSAFDFGIGAPQGFLEAAVAGTPDISDQVAFLSSWLAGPQYTHGLTFVGGLVPGNYQWNPSVWSLHIVNPTLQISETNSGGLRLVAPIWGLVSFGWAGVLVVSVLEGFLVGFLAQIAKRIIPSASVVQSTLWLVLYVSVLDVVTDFYKLSYISIIQLVIIVLVLSWRINPARKAQWHDRLTSRKGLLVNGR